MYLRATVEGTDLSPRPSDGLILETRLRLEGYLPRFAASQTHLSAAVSLARPWQAKGKTREAHDLLGGVHGWFTEGFETADLKEAKALLES